MQENQIKPEDIAIEVVPVYEEDQSQPHINRYVHSYTITISNLSAIEVQLLSRHWLIKDSNLKVEEVIGEGVVGEKPVLKQGESFEYTSFAILETDVGTMEGFYHFEYLNHDNEKAILRVPIPAFVLSIPRQIH